MKVRPESGSVTVSQMFESPQVFGIADRAELFDRWEAEAARFRRYYRHLTPEQRAAPVLASPCGHAHGEHVPCMIVWIEAALRFFAARLQGSRIPFREEPSGMSMLDFTNQRIASLDGLNWEDLWKRLETSDMRLRDIVKQLPDSEVFTNRDRIWEHLVWSAFGHYGEHSDEWEWEQAGKPGYPPDHEYSSPLLEKYSGKV